MFTSKTILEKSKKKKKKKGKQTFGNLVIIACAILCHHILPLCSLISLNTLVWKLPKSLFY